MSGHGAAARMLRIKAQPHSTCSLYWPGPVCNTSEPPSPCLQAVPHSSSATLEVGTCYIAKWYHAGGTQAAHPQMRTMFKPDDRARLNLALTRSG